MAHTERLQITAHINRSVKAETVINSKAKKEMEVVTKIKKEVTV